MEEPGTKILFKVATTTHENALTFHNDLFETLNDKNKNLQRYKEFILERYKFSSGSLSKFGQLLMPGKGSSLSNESKMIEKNQFLEKAILENY